MRLGRSFPQQAVFVPAPAPNRFDMVVSLGSVGVSSVGKASAVSTIEEASNPSPQDHVEILNPVHAVGSVETVSILIQQGPQATITVLTGAGGIGKVSDVSVIDSGTGWTSTNTASVKWRRLEDFVYPQRNPIGDIDFCPIISERNTWEISTDTDSTVLLRSEASISDDTLIEGLP